MKKAYVSIHQHLNERLIQIDQVAECLRHLLGIPDENRIWPLIQRKTLILMTDDSVVATHARFQRRQICKQLNQQLGVHISTIEIKLLSLPLHPAVRTIPRIKVSRQTSSIIQSIASDIPDTELGTALHQLAEAISEAPVQLA